MNYRLSQISPAAANEPKLRFWRSAVFWTALILGGILRFAVLGKIPAGLNSDEASSGVEALSILQTGMDRWGNHLPVWFPAWGSGMNALYSYIAIPVIAMFGLNVVTLRAIGAVFGFLTLPVAYRTARLYFGRDAALVTLTLLAVLPWHLMSSRWALDSNLLPLFFTLGLLMIGKALRDGGKWPVLAFIPWAIAVYAYPAGIIPIGLSGAGILVFFRRRICQDLWPWIAGIVAAKIIALPFLLFLVKNQLGLNRLPFEEMLPFSVPVLPATRLSQIHQSIVTTLFDNLTFIFGGYRDGAVWHQSVYFLPLTGAAPYLTLLGIFTLARHSRRTGQPPVFLPNIILIVAATAILPICLLPLNLTRFNWFYIPSMMIVANLLTNSIAIEKRAAIGLSAAYLVIFTALFAPYYFLRYNDEILVEDVNLGNGFRVGLEDALRAETALAQPGEPVFVDVGTVHPYLYVLFYGLGDIRQFQATRQVRIENGVYSVSRFDRFFFERDALPAAQSYVFVSRSNKLPCDKPDSLTSGPLWAVGRCPAL